MNRKVGLFLASALNVLAENYSFSDARILEKIKNEKILLPSKEVCEPNWDYMESYMKQILNESEQKLDNLQKVMGGGTLIEVKNWKEFRVGDLFEIKSSKSVDKIHLNFER